MRERESGNVRDDDDDKFISRWSTKSIVTICHKINKNSK